MARKPWYKALFERDYYDYFIGAGPRQRTHEEDAQRNNAQVDFIVEALGVPEGARVLDLCCGWGRLSIPLAERGYRVAGLDLSKYHIRPPKQAAKRPGVAPAFVNGDSGNIPAPPRSAA